MEHIRKNNFQQREFHRWSIKKLSWILLRKTKINIIIMMREVNKDHPKAALEVRWRIYLKKLIISKNMKKNKNKTILFRKLSIGDTINKSLPCI